MTSSRERSTLPLEDSLSRSQNLGLIGNKQVSRQGLSSSDTTHAIHFSDLAFLATIKMFALLALCRSLCRNHSIPTRLGGCRGVSLEVKYGSGTESQTRMDSALAYHCDFFGITRSSSGSRIRDQGVGGSNPLSPTNRFLESINYRHRKHDFGRGSNSTSSIQDLSPISISTPLIFFGSSRCLFFRIGRAVSLQDPALPPAVLQSCRQQVRENLTADESRMRQRQQNADPEIANDCHSRWIQHTCHIP
jgi:hypothetical protein